MTRRRRSFIAALLLSAAFAAAAAPEQPLRDFGYFIGDVLTQRVPLQRAGENLELAEAPPNGRTGRWLRRLASASQRDEAGRNWLLLEYQIINSPREPVTVALPELHLRVVDGEPLAVAPVPISISPLTPAAGAGGGDMPGIRPDRPPVPPDTAVAARRLQLGGLALGITLAAWLGWWLWRLYARAERAPFAAALQRLRALEADRLDENPEAWLALHRAFNATAGRSVTGSDIGVLMRQAPWLASQRTRIDEFFDNSALRFFAQDPRPAAFALRELARDLYRAEKRHAGSRRPRGQR